MLHVVEREKEAVQEDQCVRKNELNIDEREEWKFKLHCVEMNNAELSEQIRDKNRLGI